jgi:biotin carboxyl carrier protein
VQYEVEIGGRIRHVRVNRENGLFVVDVDGRCWQVDAVRLDAQRLSLLIAAARPDKQTETPSPGPAPASVEVALTPNGAPGQLAVQVGTATIYAAVNGRRWRRRDDHTGHTSGPQRVVAPMPGKVVRVLVSAGQTIAARQPLVVVEAMKMENELRAAASGVVSQIAVTEGQSVDAGALLVVIASDASQA